MLIHIFTVLTKKEKSAKRKKNYYYFSYRTGKSLSRAVRKKKVSYI